MTAVLTPSGDSRIEMEARMPVEGWNGRFLAEVRQEAPDVSTLPASHAASDRPPP